MCVRVGVVWVGHVQGVVLYVCGCVVSGTFVPFICKQCSKCSVLYECGDF
jgi:hypothetical protein